MKNGIIFVDLDLDDTSSYGPETTTIHKMTEDRYVFYIPMTGSGRIWTVFEYNVKEKKLKTVNLVSHKPIFN